MCTVTVLPEAVLEAAPTYACRRLRLRVACNRDELLTRAPGLPPRTFSAGVLRTVMPVDPESGGTWIGANGAGLVCVLLNLSDGSGPRAAELSRGTIIPPLLNSPDVDGALTAVRRLQTWRYAPFRLLMAQPGRFAEVTCHRGSVEWRDGDLDQPLMRTSSGLGDDLVIGPRADLFRSFFQRASDPVAAEDLFHLHQWRGREAISVRMRRLDARTVSHTVVEVTDRTVSVAYRPAEAPDGVTVTMAA